MKWAVLRQYIKFFDTRGNAEFEVKGVDLDSRKIAAGYVFVAVSGIGSDGHDFINSAIEAGAKAIICEKLPIDLSNTVEYVLVHDAPSAAGILADIFFSQPSRSLRLIGVTGTNGKTTTVTMLYRLAKALGYKAGLLSTVRNYVHDLEIKASHTTPDVIRINQLLADMVAAGCDYAFMEVSSHAMKQSRVSGLHFAGGVFTNLTHDHLDYHGSFKEYLNCKKLFFDSLAQEAFAVINIDDKNGPVMVQNCKAAIKYYGFRQMADYKGKIVANTLQGLILDINGTEVHSRLVGAFNGYNFLAVFSTAIQLGFPGIEVLAAMSEIKAVDGRFDTYFHEGRKVLGIVDYAHTPDALDNVLDTIRQLRNKDARLITVVGCGGDRDRTKRPIMARIAIDKSDLVIFTADNPRNEDPMEILDDMIRDLSEVEQRNLIVQADRKEAIKMAALLATKPGDIILIAGKGHENYQEIKGVRFPFDDKIILKEVLI